VQITQILLLFGLALLLRLAPAAARRWLVFAASVVVLYWLQPGLPVRGLAYWLPTATLALAALGWLVTAPESERANRSNLAAGGLLLLLALLVGLTRYVFGGEWLLASPPPAAGTLAAGLGLAAGSLLGLGWLLRGKEIPAWLPAAGVAMLIALFVMLKTPALELAVVRGLRQASGQDPRLAAALDLRWLGFSYIAFRLLHTLRDRQAGRLPVVGLRDYLSYVIFFPALVAGPIDRLERFEKDSLALASDQPSAERREQEFTEAGRRLIIGLVKKFVVADTLGLVALSPGNATQVSEMGWMWLLLYLYALQIYFDFSGYTDIAIATGLLLGVKLPENFAAPYLKPNLTQFWNSWHMSLTQWFRGYFFNPLVRWMRKKRGAFSPPLILFLSQVSTMLLIGLWHGVTVNFVLWGLWHGLGMFVQNRWSEMTRAWFAERSFSPLLQRTLGVLSTLFTFHFFALGWVFFLLPTPQMAGKVFQVLFGLP